VETHRGGKCERTYLRNKSSGKTFWEDISTKLSTGKQVERRRSHGAIDIDSYTTKKATDALELKRQAVDDDI